MLQEVTTKFKQRYTKLFTDLNSKMFPAPITYVGPDQVFEIPKVDLLGGKVGVSSSNSQLKDLGKPHIINLTFTRVVPAETVVSADIPVTEVLNSLKDDRYFNFLFDSIVDGLVKSYAEKVGPYDAIRWGESYLSFVEFKESDPSTVPVDSIQLVLKGKIATKDEYKQGENNAI